MSVTQCRNVSLHREFCRESGQRLPAAADMNSEGTEIARTSRSAAWITPKRGRIWVVIITIAHSYNHT